MHNFSDKIKLIWSIGVIAVSLWVVSCDSKSSLSDVESVPDQVSFNFHIRPILSDNCFACHGPDANKREAGLRLDTPEGAYAALKDNLGLHAVIPGKPGESELVKRIYTSDPSEKMPPMESNLILTEEQKETLERWVKQGAVYEPHWAFTKPLKAEVPLDTNDPWSKNEIDRFLWKAMSDRGLQPNEAADKAFLLKRISLDITGLPPSPEDLRLFLDDTSADATEKLIDRLLKHKAYGERMAGLWMDISRYSDSFGYQNDNYRTQWPYRDWVIHAFNKNMPYDQFITWQLAGDLMDGATKEHILATGFNRNHKYTEEEGVIDEEYRIEYVLDKTNTFTKAILGVTAECAQCHDHKYDPISQEDYFSLFAFFNNTPEKGFEGGAGSAIRSKTPLMTIDKEDVDGILSFVNVQDTSRIYVSVMEDFKDTLRNTYILDRGVYDAPTDQRVQPRTPEAILSFGSQYPQNRLGLAQWTFSDENPLTARVFVNLIWQEIFGVGLVASTGDFGMQGDLPTHPELLDWLAVDFQENGWDIQYLIKKIMGSAAYMQSAVVNPSNFERDPENIFLSRFPRLRLNAEHIRDFVLASSGLLVPEIGGPSVKPYQPDGLWEASSSGRGELAVYRTDSGDKLYRRGMYTFIKLTLPPPALLIFDGSNRDICQVKRQRTNTPLQALALLNDPMVLEASRVMAANLDADFERSEDAISEAFVRILGRTPKKDEQELLEELYTEELKRFEDDREAVDNLLSIGKYGKIKGKSPETTAALMQVIVALYNLEEATTKT